MRKFVLAVAAFGTLSAMGISAEAMPVAGSAVAPAPMANPAIQKTEVIVRAGPVVRRRVVVRRPAVVVRRRPAARVIIR